MKKSQVQKIAKRYNAEINKEKLSDGGYLLTATLNEKDKQLWIERDGITLSTTYYPDFGENISDGWEELYERIESGVYEMPKEQYSEYGVE